MGNAEYGANGLEVLGAVTGIRKKVAAFGPFIPGVEGDHAWTTRLSGRKGFRTLERCLEGSRSVAFKDRCPRITARFVAVALNRARTGVPTHGYVRVIRNRVLAPRLVPHPVVALRRL